MCIDGYGFWKNDTVTVIDTINGHKVNCNSFHTIHTHTHTHTYIHRLVGHWVLSCTRSTSCPGYSGCLPWSLTPFLSSFSPVLQVSYVYVYSMLCDDCDGCYILMVALLIRIMCVHEYE
ncbi:hypothetical protein EON63_06675 [archaeon]|nr:MAG: hypothetical protein EON63_06675 [archaeon]